MPTREVSPWCDGLSTAGGLPVISRSMKPDRIGGIGDVRGARRRRGPWRMLCDQPRRTAVGDDEAGLTLHQPHLTSWRKGGTPAGREVLLGVLALIQAVIQRAEASWLPPVRCPAKLWGR